MKKIPLSGKKGAGKFVLVDDTDFEQLGHLKWNLSVTGYAVRRNKADGKIVKMHRVILDAKPGQEIDHRDRNPLNNQRSNIRISNRSENNHNTKIKSTNTSGVRGVNWNKRDNNWEVRIQVWGKVKRLGYYKDFEVAKLARKWGEKAYLCKYGFKHPLDMFL